MPLSSAKKPILLTDEQMREFIVNGYLVLQPSVPDALHQTISQKLTETLALLHNPGNNILPLVPEMRHIINSPEVQGALISVLGEGFFEHPHRFCHALAPATEKSVDLAAQVAKNCHQDGYSPLARSRQHYLRNARIMYYPQDTPLERGPTHVIPGTQFNQGLTDEERASALPVAGKAGTVSLTHFDLGHAAGVNLVDQPRHMVKFIYIRASAPTAPTWDCQNSQFQKPGNIQAPHDLQVAWSHHWDWLCGKQDRYESIRNQRGGPASGAVAGLAADLAEGFPLDRRLAASRDLAFLGAAAAAAIPALIDMLAADHQAARTAAVYVLGAIGAAAVEPLVEQLREAGRREDEFPDPPSWKERGVEMELAAFALAAIGTPAVDPLIEVLEESSEWSRINAAFALGEMDAQAAAAVPSLIKCLDDRSYRVVRQAADVLGLIRSNVDVSSLSRLLSAEGRPGWKEKLNGKWAAHDQVRVNAAMACVRLGKDAAVAEEALLDALDDECGHVGAFAMYALNQMDSPSARLGVVDYLRAQRWDESIKEGRPY
jgi:HEAT repeat protein